MNNATERGRALTRLWRLPAARWLADYRAAWLPHDVVAGITLAAYARYCQIRQSGALAGNKQNQHWQ